jgi:uncharacterized protein (DUF302 family)
MRILLFTILLFIYTVNSFADGLLMIRSKQKFPEAMLTLQTSIKEHGYTITRVQRIDIGLTKKGYKTDKYRVVFVGKTKEIQYLVNKYPELIAFMPPKISIFAEGETTMLVTADPSIFEDMVTDKEDKYIFRRWRSDIYSVFENVRTADD